MTIRGLWDCECQGAVELSWSCRTVTVREQWNCDWQQALGLLRSCTTVRELCD